MARLSPERLVFTSAFGARDPIQTPKGKTPAVHIGVDYGPEVRNKKGVPLQSLIDGRVTWSNDQFGALSVRTTAQAGGDMLALLRRIYGSWVTAGMSVTLDLWHLASRDASRRNVKVSAGTVLGVMGSTGLSTGVHVHVELRIGGRVVDPKPFIDAQASKAVAPAPADYYGEDDVALDDRQAAALEHYWQHATVFEELLKRYERIDRIYQHVVDGRAEAKPIADRVGLLDTMAGQVEQVFLRRAAIDQMGVRVQAIHDALPALQQASDVALDADEIASLAASIAAALPRQDAQAVVDALAKQLAKP